MSTPPPPSAPRTSRKRPRSLSPSISPASTSTLPTLDLPMLELLASSMTGLPIQGPPAQAPTLGLAPPAPSPPSQDESDEERRKVRSDAPTPSPNLGAAHGYSAATDPGAPHFEGEAPIAGSSSDGAPQTSGSAPEPKSKFEAHRVQVQVAEQEQRRLAVPQNDYFEGATATADSAPIADSGRGGHAHSGRPRIVIPHSPSDPTPQCAGPSSSAPMDSHGDCEVGAGPAPGTAAPKCAGPSSSAPLDTHKAPEFGAGLARGAALPICDGSSSSAPVGTNISHELGARLARGAALPICDGSSSSAPVGTRITHELGARPAPGIAVPTSGGQASGAESFVGRLGSFMRGTREAIIARQQHRREERARALREVRDSWALSGMVGNRGGRNGNRVGNGAGGCLHDGNGDIDMDGDIAMAGDDAMDMGNAMNADATMHGNVTMDGAGNGTEHAGPQNGYEDNDETVATAPVGPPSMRTTHDPTPYVPHRSAPLLDPLQMVPPNVLPPAARGHRGAMKLPRPEAVSRERERGFGSPAGTTVPRDEDGREPESPRGRRRYRD
ncbi:hypothetical protein VF21_00303 [Pseudogymnoascus sp. 05NY08]|nr:hypothetical protein VF21_00303 [Pseudogymnoascus sp. 05NY08]